MDFSIVFVGTAGSVPTARRGLPATLVRHGGSRVLIDCGEGTQRQLVRSTGLVDLDAIFITHFHADHWLGLPGLLKTFDLRDRERPLVIHGPKGIHSVLETAVLAAGATRFQVETRELEVGEAVEFETLNIAPFPVKHRGSAFGYALFEHDRPGRIDLEKAAELGIQPGPDLGLLQRGESVGSVSPGDVMGGSRPGRKVVLSGDTSPCDSLLLAADGADVLVHEATFLQEEAGRAAERGHTTAAQAAECASEAGVKLLALTHLSSRYGGREVEEEARTVFENSYVPRDFDAVEIPFAESGEPTLVRPQRHKRPRDRAQHTTSAAEGASLDEKKV